MEMIRVKYLGNKAQKATLDRHRFFFNKENDFTCDVPVKLATELFRLGNYTSVPLTMPEPKVEPKIEPKVKMEIKTEIKTKVNEPIKKPVGRPKKGVR